MLCNKSDVDEAKDEVHVVNALNVERLVNVARCPTRVEPSVATKNQGIKEGFKWLVKSIIANFAELGPRIDKDVEEEQKREAERREEVRKRLEERKNDDANEDQEDDQDNDQEPPGFVPISEAIITAESRTLTNAEPPNQTEEAEDNTNEADNDNEVNNEDLSPKTPELETVEANPDDLENTEASKDFTEPEDSNEKIVNGAENNPDVLPGAVPEVSDKPETELEPMKAPEALPPLVNGASSSRRNSSSSNVKSNSSSRRNSHANGMENFLKSGKMDLEPTNGGSNGLKKAPFGRRLSNASVKTNASSKASSAGSRKSTKLPPV